ncbi:14115_t:CDS:2, partial [Funneliformis mosseae]
PLTSEQIKHNINKLKGKLAKPVEEMVPPTIPRGITEECKGGNKLNEVALKILDTLKSVWCNPAFGPEFVETMNEGTYVNN